MAETVNSMQFVDSDMYGPDVALDNDENEMCDEENVLGGSNDDDDEDDADAPSLTRSSSTGGTVLQQHWDEEEILHNTGNNSPEITSNLNQMVVEHHPGSTTALDGGWFARIAALLVGEDPTQCYALICGNCHKHNGLARKEDFPYITYYCPHCNALNGSKHPNGISGSDLPGMSSLITGGNIDPINNIGRVTMTDTDMTPVSSSPVALSAVETIEGSEAVLSGVPDPVS
ncbi:endoplasmic reticulum junction formation protein lunapark-1-like [Camellia sinensis]|uniref:endoplasmic reticulum junction formation protein lunapark-1-like n=1 Tax=Camellia sinensis TaxID=4442 RepID=UPI0010368E9A|nr:endoplasmic reticulum junction formation protein lunapark-1-like [Camellia sinensis]